MDELFRFLLLRPAASVSPSAVQTLTPSFAGAAAPPAVLKQEATRFVGSARFVVDANHPALRRGCSVRG